MLAYDWILALVAFAVAAPLALVLRVVQRHLVAAYDEARERNGEMLAAVTEVVTGAGDDRAPTTPATRSDRPGRRRRSSERTKSQIKAPGDRRLPVPVGRGLLGAHRRRGDRRRRRPGPGERAHRRGDDRLHLPHLPVPRADRRVHRGPRPDPDRGRRAAARARRARPAGRPAAARVAARRSRRARSTSTSATSRSRTRRVASRPRSTRPCCATSTCTSRPASRWRWSVRPDRARRRSGG